jgi:hypothetical protein
MRRFLFGMGRKCGAAKGIVFAIQHGQSLFLMLQRCFTSS